MEASVLSVRDAHPAWGGRKIRRRLLDLAKTAPAASTVGQILRRHGRITPEASDAATPWHRFEHAEPNDLWQMDFKGHFPTGEGSTPCHPLTILDDCSRYALGMFACADERGATVKGHLLSVFGRYGLPRRMLCDNGPPWGCSHDGLAYTKLELWLLRLDVTMSHGRPYHPQTQGKDERFHRTLKAEVLQGRRFESVAAVQPVLDGWRPVYNQERPHEALGLATPSTRYRMSARSLPAELPALRYDAKDQVRKVNAVGRISFGGQSWQLGEAFAGQTIALRRAIEASVWDVYFGRHHVARLDQEKQTLEAVRDRPRLTFPPLAPLAAGTSAGVTHVSEQVSPMCPA
jgi:transposase InsO family protein